MPIKRVQFPDGSIHRIEVPEGATDEQIIDFVKAQHPAAPDRMVGQTGEPVPASYVKDALQSALHHGGNAVLGAGQLLNHGAAWVMDKALPEDNPARRWQDRIIRQGDFALQKREGEYQRTVPTNGASISGAALGEVAPWMIGMGELRALGMLPKVTQPGLMGLAIKGGLLGAEGGAMGATSPVTEQGSYASQKGTQIGLGVLAAPALAAGAKGVAATVGGLARLSRYATPAGREAIANERVSRIFANDPESLANLQRDSGIPGYEFTPVQANPSAQALQVERTLRNNPDTAGAFATREADNNKAAREFVAGVAKPGADGADPAMEAAKAARTQATQPYREKYLPENRKVLVDPAPVVAALKKLQLSGVDTVRQAARKHLALLEQHMAENGGRITTTALDDIRQGVGSTLRSIPQNGAVTPKEVALYAPVSSAITDTLERAVPGYRNYLAAYAHHSQPINDMEAARTLLAAIDSGGRDVSGNQAVSLNAVKALIARDNKAEFPMSESARKQIETVLDALQRRTIAHNNLAAAGPGTAADVQRAIRASPLLMRIIGHTAAGVGGMHFGYPGILAGSAAVEGMNALNNRVVSQVGQKAASAKSVAQILQPQPQLPSPSVFDYLLPYDTRALPPAR